MNRLFAKKSVADFEADIVSHGGLKRTLGKWHLTALGVGATIGAGIFATTGTAIVGDAARPGAGPAIIFSFLLTAVACGFAALCYAEFAAMVPIAGSAYTYAYASLGAALDSRCWREVEISASRPRPSRRGASALMLSPR